MVTHNLSRIDEKLWPFLLATDEAAEEMCIESLLTKQAEPVIRQIITYKLRAYSSRNGPGYSDHEADDLNSEVFVKLLDSLRLCKENPQEKGIANFRGYVATTAYNACAERLRRKRPQHYNLRSKLRRLLTTMPGLALWRDERDELVGGFAVWKEKGMRVSRNALYRQLCDDPQAFSHQALPGKDVMRMTLPDLVAAMLDWAGGPVELDDLMAASAALLGVREQQEQLDEKEGFDGSLTMQLADPKADVAGEVAKRIYLRQVWEEICQLPVPQRMALLLNLRDEGGGCITVLWDYTGVAPLYQIAEALELPPEEFCRIWGNLPLEDLKIAELLGISRQQVINLRKAARERLARRMKAAGA